MLFLAAPPMDRYRMLEHFYGLDSGLIERFYAGKSTRLDRLRVFAGRPPVPVTRALPVLAASLFKRRGPGAKPSLWLGYASNMKRACVIGAGFGGLALAIRLQAGGVQTTLVEARDKPGGRAYVWERDGFTFDAGPTVITDPACLEELWALSAHRMADDVELLPVMPFYRLNWPDGTTFDYSNDEVALRAEIARISPRDIAGYEEFLLYAGGVYQEGYVKLGSVPFLDFASMVRAAPALARYQAWRSVYSVVSKFLESEKLREAFSFHTLLVGGNPMTTSAIYALIHKLEKDSGVWWARGGTNQLVAAMVRQFERIGGEVRLGDKVERIETLGNRVTGIHTASGWHGNFDAVASNGDIMHTYRDLLGESPVGRRRAAALKRKRFSPSLFVVHFGIEGTWPGIPTIRSCSGRATRACSTTSSSMACCRRISRSTSTIRP
jgi:phytoene desaturase